VIAPRFQVVVLCTANRFRSPIAASVLRRELDSQPVEITSRGVLDVGPLPPLVDALRAATELDLQLANHRARSVATGELADKDLVVGFERAHLVAATDRGRARPSVVFTLPELVDLLGRLKPPGSKSRASMRTLIAVAAKLRGESIPEAVPEINDPIGKAPSVCDATAARVAELAAKLAHLLGTTV